MCWRLQSAFAHAFAHAFFLVLIANGSFSAAKQREERFSLLYPFGGEEPSDTGLPSLPIPIPVPVPNILGSEVPDYCKDPLKRLISFVVQTGVSRILSLIRPNTVPEFADELQAKQAADTAEAIIEAGLTEGNMARAVSRVAAMNLRLYPFVGASLAERIEPQIETATRTALNGLCSTLNCCFD